MKLALFDLDHTLIPFDSDHEWGRFCCTLGWVDRDEHHRKNELFYAQYRNGGLDMHEYLAFALAPLAARSPQELQAAHSRFMREVVLPQLPEPGRALVQRHREQGHACVVVTATNEFVTRPIAEHLGVSELIAIELARDGEGRYTGKPQGTLSFQGGKVTRVEQWLAARDLTLDQCETWFYSDSVNDLALLERVTHPVATNPDARLRALAQRHGWPVLDLFSQPPTP